MNEEKVGIKEIKDVINLANALALILIRRLKDGVGMDDVAFLLKLAEDKEFKALLSEALKDFKLIPEEFEDVSLNEGMELAMIIIMSIPAYIEAAKK